MQSSTWGQPFKAHGCLLIGGVLGKILSQLFVKSIVAAGLLLLPFLPHWRPKSRENLLRRPQFHNPRACLVLAAGLLSEAFAERAGRVIERSSSQCQSFLLSSSMTESTSPSRVLWI